MPSTYAKPYLSFQQQLGLLKSRGLGVTDDAAALSWLRRIGYYRLSAYWYPLRSREIVQDPDTAQLKVVRQDAFVSGANFEHALDLYIFDNRLRLLMIDAIERIEVAFRVEVSHLLGAKDTFAHVNPAMLHGNFTKKVGASGKTQHQEWLEKYERALSRSKEDFFLHFQAKYGEPLPIWVAVELWDFGMLSNFYRGMTTADRAAIAANYGVTDSSVFASWLRSMNFVRNVAAHHSRLWNKNLIDQPKFPRRGEINAFDPLVANPQISADISSRLYSVLCILLYLLKVCNPNSSWQRRLRELLDAFPQIAGLSLSDMGFPSGWESHDFWN